MLFHAAWNSSRKIPFSIIHSRTWTIVIFWRCCQDLRNIRHLCKTYSNGKLRKLIGECCSKNTIDYTLRMTSVYTWKCWLLLFLGCVKIKIGKDLWTIYIMPCLSVSLKVIGKISHDLLMTRADRSNINCFVEIKVQTSTKQNCRIWIEATGNIFKLKTFERTALVNQKFIPFTIGFDLKNLRFN